MLERRKLVKELLAERGDLLVVWGLGSPPYDVAAGGDHPVNLFLWGGMGGAAMIGLGLALARPDRRVAVLTGDGEALMGLGALATIGVKQPKNLCIVVLDNGHYGETGMQPSHTTRGGAIPRGAQSRRFRAVRRGADIHGTAPPPQRPLPGPVPHLIHPHIPNATLPT